MQDATPRQTSVRHGAESYTIALRPDVAKAVRTALPKRGTMQAALGAIVAGMVECFNSSIDGMVLVEVPSRERVTVCLTVRLKDINAIERVLNGHEKDGFYKAADADIGIGLCRRLITAARDQVNLNPWCTSPRRCSTNSTRFPRSR